MELYINMTRAFASLELRSCSARPFFGFWCSAHDLCSIYKSIQDVGGGCFKKLRTWLWWIWNNFTKWQKCPGLHPGVVVLRQNAPEYSQANVHEGTFWRSISVRHRPLSSPSQGTCLSKQGKCYYVQGSHQTRTVIQFQKALETDLLSPSYDWVPWRSFGIASSLYNVIIRCTSIESRSWKRSSAKSREWLGEKVKIPQPWSPTSSYPLACNLVKKVRLLCRAESRSSGCVATLSTNASLSSFSPPLRKCDLNQIS